ncbi:hypothetical protein KO561_04995 [Radiobacillus kanasensis]|uniref:hypothetical protein n=1 Tax=Radiobacillus kanasensis TaxID=2844358 RepID=UPI001E65CEEF|nr:hypothetical protein [Radiobacillus kanasensis]UFU00311.1 hypothetical protein KO561_04995 [Radiobacillus kanasensis]
MSYHEDNENKPFNDAMDHMQKIEGVPNNSGGRLPLGIRFIGYFLVGGIALIILFGLVASLLD